MRLLLFLLACSTSNNPNAGKTCDPNVADVCGDGLTCCRPCRGIPLPPDAADEGTCQQKCEPQICP